MESLYVIITVILVSILLLAINSYIQSTYKDPIKSLKHAEVYFNEMLFSQAKVTIKRARKYHPSHTGLLARLHQYENEQSKKRPLAYYGQLISDLREIINITMLL